MKLIKITNDHYVVVDDSEIEKDDFYVSFDESYNPPRYVVYNMGVGTNGLNPMKITHSTNININELYYIPLQEVKELISEVDIEKKARENASMCEDDWEDGYNQALEDNKDKKYTEDDVIEFAIWRSITLFDQPHPLTPKGQFELWKSIQFKTEWEIEEIDGKFKLK